MHKITGRNVTYERRLTDYCINISIMDQSALHVADNLGIVRDKLKNKSFVQQFCMYPLLDY